MLSVVFKDAIVHCFEVEIWIAVRKLPYVSQSSLNSSMQLLWSRSDEKIITEDHGDLTNNEVQVDRPQDYANVIGYL